MSFQIGDNEHRAFYDGLFDVLYLTVQGGRENLRNTF